MSMGIALKRQRLRVWEVERIGIGGIISCS